MPAGEPSPNSGASRRKEPADILVPRAEHLAAMKIHAMKSDPSRTFKELADIQFLLGLPGIDEQEIRGCFEKEGLKGRFDELKKTLAGERDPTTPVDVAALRRASRASAEGEPDYLAFLARSPPTTAAELRARPGPRGAPFRL